MNHQSLSSFIWSVADLLRGDYKQSDYGKVILPFTVLRRLDCVLEATKPKVLTEFAAKTKQKLNPDPLPTQYPDGCRTASRGQWRLSRFERSIAFAQFIGINYSGVLAACDRVRASPVLRLGPLGTVYALHARRAATGPGPPACSARLWTIRYCIDPAVAVECSWRG
jgi:HsdM N-terminal domain